VSYLLRAAGFLYIDTWSNEKSRNKARLVALALAKCAKIHKQAEHNKKKGTLKLTGT
jgi:hypothetical protein